MSNGVNFRQLALDLRSELTKCQRLNAELLEALEAFVNYNTEENGDVSIMSNDALWIKAESAIAKARGEA